MKPQHIVVLTCGCALLGVATWQLLKPVPVPPRVVSLSESDQIVEALLGGQSIELRHSDRSVLDPEPEIFDEDFPYKRTKYFESLGPIHPEVLKDSIQRMARMISADEEAIKRMENGEIHSTEDMLDHAGMVAGLELWRAVHDSMRKGLGFLSTTHPGSSAIPGYMFPAEATKTVHLDSEGNVIIMPDPPEMETPEEHYAWHQEKLRLTANPIEVFAVYPVRVADYPALIAAQDREDRIRRVILDERLHKFNSLTYQERKRAVEEWYAQLILVENVENDDSLTPEEKQRRLNELTSKNILSLAGFEIDEISFLAILDPKLLK
jgi:hypothetical protein